jgi:hypothetical protein
LSTNISRLPDIYGRGNRIPVGHTEFYKNYVYHPGGDEFIPGTNIPRLRLVALGKRSVGAFDDEVDQMVEALRALRDSAPPRPSPFTREQIVKGSRTRTARRRGHAAAEPNSVRMEEDTATGPTDCRLHCRPNISGDRSKQRGGGDA